MEIYIQTEHQNNFPSGGSKDYNWILRSGKVERVTFVGEKAWSAPYIQMARNWFVLDLWLTSGQEANITLYRDSSARAL